jgi:Spy/CpxP family protein refolding chaperone
MTTPAEGGPSARSRGRLVWVALVLSVILNVMFIGGLFWIRTAVHPPPGTPERFLLAAGELDLSADQKKSVQELIGQIRQFNRKLRESNKPLVDEIWNELIKTEADSALIDRLVDQASENRRLYQKEMTAALGHFILVLTPEQRSRFVELAKKPHDHAAARFLKRLGAP